MNFLKDIQTAYRNASIVEKIIYINIAVFFIALLSQHKILNWLAFPANSALFILKPWSLISYAFIHQDLFHLLSNLIVLFYIGNLFLDFFSDTQFIAVYSFGILAGAAFFFFGIQEGILIGASAAATAVFVAIATKIPHYNLRLRFIGSVELWVLAAIWIGLSLLQVGAENKGGQLSHLGGALIGFIFTKLLLTKGIDLSKPFTKLQTLGTTLHRSKKKPTHLKTVYKSSKNIKRKTTASKQQKINQILDKISKSGYESLSKEDKDFLFKAGNNRV